MRQLKRMAVFYFWVFLSFAGQGAQITDHITQYGITWTFDQEYPVGQFVNGDWWVIGPVTVVRVSPEPGPGSPEDAGAIQKGRYGATALVADQRMRNGSMIIEGKAFSEGDRTGFEKQGYDSRVINYAASRSVEFPCKLKVNRSLISTVSSEKIVGGKLSTPDLMGQSGFALCQPTATVVLETAAVLTCLEAIPPQDAFRPPYVGTEKPIYRAGDIQWKLLPNLPVLKSTPDWNMMARNFERPWLDHTSSWVIQHTLPGLNSPHYGREFARMSSIAALMLLEEVSQETKTPLMINYLQLGIDLSGLAQCGRQWASDGGHWQGRKWPILFASLMLGNPAIRNFPPVDLSKDVYGPCRLLKSDAVPVPTTLFQEDIDYYYGQKNGHKALWQITYHTGPKPLPQQEPDLADMPEMPYHINNMFGGSGVALAAQLMGARALWNKEAFFDHIDWWMLKADWPTRPKWALNKTVDQFIEDMWAEYRDDVPGQPKGTDNIKWVWKEGSTGVWEANPKEF